MSDLNVYPYVVASIPPEEGGGYVVSFADIPGCLGVGDTPEEAVEDGQRALFACLDALKAVDREPPAPSVPTA
ncbi:MAG TPA: type II toxin-antitoxin system HicB family antitoxin [Methylocella sp.]|nr:type II toxin-antitoxin system HicB family antitoxin [Methylocella sp.]